MVVTVIVTMLLVGGARAGDSGNNMTDTGYRDNCEYAAKKIYDAADVGCGDICMGANDTCECGLDKIYPNYNNLRCCIPPGKSCYNRKYGDGVCSEGRTLSISSHCGDGNTTQSLDRSLQCYNSYQDSQFIGAKSHYTCPHTCVHWEDMCQGVSSCQCAAQT